MLSPSRLTSPLPRPEAGNHRSIKAGEAQLARRAAVEAESKALLAHSMGEQAYVLVDAGHEDLALQLIREAVRQATGKTPRRLMAWLHLAEAEIAASTPGGSGSREALDRAEAVMPSGTEMRDDEVRGVFLNEAHALRWRGNVLALLGEQTALDHLHGALGMLDGSFTRAEAGLRIELANAYLASGKMADAKEHALVARSLINQTGSLRHRRRLDRLILRLG